MYFDHNATTPLDPRVREAMLAWLGPRFGNPSSVHGIGRAAREAVENARQQVAFLIGASPSRVMFTASGTEANNAVVFSCAENRSSGHFVLSAIEHPSVQAAADRLEAAGWAITRVAPDRSGRVEPQRILEAIREDTAVVSLMLANNEIGTIQPVAEVAAGCRQAGVRVFCDAVQAAGKVPVDVESLGVDFLSIGAHKFHGPLGAAALWVRGGIDFAPFMVGGGQERRQRAGTENVPAIVGFGVAAELAATELAERGTRLAALRDAFESGVKRLADVVIHGAESLRLPNTSNLSFPGISAENLMIRLDLQGVAVSTGAACSSGKVESSATLAAIGLSEEEAASSMRLSFGITNQPAEVAQVLRVLEGELARLSVADEGGG
ncbi:MAG: cysteine desulfurase [Acidobacteriota bacterium]|nr:cysteine desulfurase [Acidobacteriota bacterium]